PRRFVVRRRSGMVVAGRLHPPERSNCRRVAADRRLRWRAARRWHTKGWYQQTESRAQPTQEDRRHGG
ncbi:hypothetical protein, partial [Enterococcus faecalis]|uniref:hypothetical protein n=1 Tax=Enterococcus faecalis TaxID=1351 RepID=UPI003D6AB286